MAVEHARHDPQPVEIELISLRKSSPSLDGDYGPVLHGHVNRLGEATFLVENPGFSENEPIHRRVHSGLMGSFSSSGMASISVCGSSPGPEPAPLAARSPA